MKKSLFYIIFIALLVSCNEALKSPNDFDPNVVNDEIEDVVMLFGNPENGRLFNYYYRRMMKLETNDDICFYYRNDSTFVHYDSSMIIERKGKQRQIQSIRMLKWNDTLIINDRAEPSIPARDHLFYLLQDSIDILVKGQLTRIYSFSNLDDDSRWDETMYFSKEYGQLYSHYPFFKKKYELIKNSLINEGDLSIILDSLKLRSGEIH